MTLLALRDVSKSFGALKVTDGITLEVQEGETLGILGPNGAGKTTLFNLISGDVRADAGQVQYDGIDITGLPPHRRCRAGIGRSYQVPQPFGNMSVFENLVTAACFGGGEDEKQAWHTAQEVLEQTGLHAHANKPAGGLALLDRKRLELARALATRPKLLLLDEPSLGLAPIIIQQIFSIIQKVNANGTTVFLVEQNANQALRIANHGYVMENGRIVMHDTAANLLTSEEVRTAYLGM